MANDATLKAKPHTETGKSRTRKMRAAGHVPAVVYGHGEQTRLLALEAHELELLFARVHWENTVIKLDIEGERGDVRALVREVQSHPYRPQVLHVDFQQIHAGELVHVQVPVRLIGNAPGARAGGVLMQPLTDLEVWCTADRIPDHLEVDVSGLQIGDSLHVRDIPLPEGVETQTDDDQTVCSVTPPAVTAVAEEPVAEAPTGEPEVIRRGREEEEG
jgi:large subunit ribosomal protein L25